MDLIKEHSKPDMLILTPNHNSVKWVFFPHAGWAREVSIMSKIEFCVISVGTKSLAIAGAWSLLEYLVNCTLDSVKSKKVQLGGLN